MNTQDYFTDVLENFQSKEISYNTQDPYIIMDAKEVLSILSLISPIIDLNARKVISRGLCIQPINNTSINVINTNDLYYFKGTLAADSNNVTETVFLDFIFLQKIAKFLPNKLVIYKKEGTYFIQLSTGDLELINPLVLESDLNYLVEKFVVTDTIKEVDLKLVEGTLEIYSKLLPLTFTAKKRVLNYSDNMFSFLTDTQIKAFAPGNFVDLELRLKDLLYLHKISKIFGTNKLEIQNIENSMIQRFCFKYGSLKLISNFSAAKRDTVLLEKYGSLPEVTIIDINSILYALSYIMSITYSTGTISLIPVEDTLVCRIHLSNGNYSTTVFKIKSKLTLKNTKPIVLKSKILHELLTSFDSTLETGLGYREGILYLINKDITIMYITE